MDIEKLDLSVRTYNCLKRYGVNTVDDFIGKMSDIKRLAPKVFKEASERIIFFSDNRKGDTNGKRT